MAKSKPLITYGSKPRPKRRLDPALFLDFTADVATMSWVPTNHQPRPLVPKRPNSQKAATMAVEPTQEQVETLKMFTSVNENTAIRWLRIKQGNIEAAANSIMEGEDLSKAESAITWDDSAFAAERDGTGSNLAPLGSSAAPTRGPSPAPSIKAPTTKADEDAEMARAIAESQQDSGTLQSYDLAGQESGRIRTDGTQETFIGPLSQQQYYNKREWAMVPYTGSQEVVPDLPVKERIQGRAVDRQDGTKEPEWYPRLLKHLPDGDYTPNLITILSAIPLAREALIMREHLQADYGDNEDWWKGAPIPKPRIVSTLDGTAVDADTDKYDELIGEVQRLVAFLDSSSRVYACTGALTQTSMIRDANIQQGSLVELFLQSWTQAASSMVHDKQKDQVLGLFTTVVGKTASEGPRTPDLSVVDMNVNTADGEKKDLAELLDNLLWETDSNEADATDHYIERPADVLIMRVQQQNKTATQLGVTVPAFFYLDKYLKANIAATKELRRQMAQGKVQVTKLEELEKKLSTWQHPQKNTQLESKQLLAHTIGHFSGKNRRNVDLADKTNNASLATHEPPSHYAEVASQLEKVMASIDDKLALLVQQKEKTRKIISEMSKAPPPSLEQSDLEHRYTLRGVATKPNITYVLRKKTDSEEADAAKVDDDMKDVIVNGVTDDETTTPANMQWWRIDYEVTGQSAKISRTKAEDYDVLRAVELEYNSALLVYASEDASDEDLHDSLPQQLARFIELDDAHLQDELKAADRELPSYSGTAEQWEQVPRNTTEKDDDEDSMRAQHDDELTDLTAGVDNESKMDSFGHVSLGYELKDDRSRTPVVDIVLDDDDEGRVIDGRSGNDVEMIEKAHAPLIPRGNSRSHHVSDVQMTGAESQDLGVGGNIQMDDKEMG